MTCKGEETDQLKAEGNDLCFSNGGSFYVTGSTTAVDVTDQRKARPCDATSEAYEGKEKVDVDLLQRDGGKRSGSLSCDSDEFSDRSSTTGSDITPEGLASGELRNKPMVNRHPEERRLGKEFSANHTNERGAVSPV